MVALAPNSRQLWREPLPADPCTSLALNADGGPMIGLHDGSIISYTADGARAQRPGPGGVPVVLAEGGGTMLAAMADGRVIVMPPPDSAAEPIVPKVVSLGARPIAAVAGSDGFYVLSARGSLVCVDTEGAERWRTTARLDGGPAALEAYPDRVVVLTRSAVYSYGLDGSEYRVLRLRNAVSTPAMAPNGTVFAGGADWIMYAYRFEHGLSALAEPSPPRFDMARIDAVAKEESLWSFSPSDDSSMMNRLADIEKSIGSGTIGEETVDAALYMSAVAMGRMEAPFGSGASVPAPTPRGAMPRAYACTLLGMLGLAQAVPILVMIFERDQDPAVRAAAAAAIAAIGLDPEGFAMEAFARATDGGRLDAQAALAVVNAIDSLYRANGALENRSGILALIRISGGNYSRAVRSRAEQALKRVSSAQ
jgi:outer membrane protein assembly factor BamB